MIGGALWNVAQRRRAYPYPKVAEPVFPTTSVVDLANTLFYNRGMLMFVGWQRAALMEKDMYVNLYFASSGFK